MKEGGAMAYSFRDLKPTNLVDYKEPLSEYIIFGDFDTRKDGWYLTERSAPSPQEQQIVETVPYMQGQYDFSMIDNERFFANREITYTFKIFNTAYDGRKELEQDIKRQLMPFGIDKLFDSHDTIYHWLGKFKSVEVTDDAKYNSLQAVLAFDCYPFAIRTHPEGSDLWDEVYFPHWYFQETKFTVNGDMEVTLKNIGSASAPISLIVTGTVSVNGLQFKEGIYTDTVLTMEIGDNRFKLSGNGTVDFQFYREELI